MKEVKQYGVHRSGTNFLRVLLQENYDVKVLHNVGGWKHGYYCLPSLAGRELDCVITCKEPRAWLCSMYDYMNGRRSQTCAVSLQEFLHSRFVLRAESGSGYRGAEFRAMSPIQYWNNMYHHWLSIPLAAHKLVHVRYEDLLSALEATLDGIAAALGLQRRREVLFSPGVHLGTLNESYTRKDLASGARFERGYYLQRRYLERFTPGMLDSVASELDVDVLQRLGYALEA